MIATPSLRARHQPPTPASRLSALLPMPCDVGQRRRAAGRPARRSSGRQWQSGGVALGPDPQLVAHRARPSAGAPARDEAADRAGQQRHVPVQPRPDHLHLERAVDEHRVEQPRALGAADARAPASTAAGARWRRARPCPSIAPMPLEQRAVEQQVAVGLVDAHREGREPLEHARAVRRPRWRRSPVRARSTTAR